MKEGKLCAAGTSVQWRAAYRVCFCKKGGEMDLNGSEIERLAGMMPGNYAIYRVRRMKLDTLYYSESLHELSGISREEYDSIIHDDAADIVLGQDRNIVAAEMTKCIETHEPLDCYYRIYNKTKYLEWIHANVKYIGDLDGDPVLLVVFTSNSRETDIYQNILDRMSSVAYVLDCDTYEILYANERARQYREGTDNSFLGQPCYKYIRGNDAPCGDCFLNTTAYGDLLSRDKYDESTGIWEHISGEYMEWCGHNAFVQYIDDISAQKNQELKFSESIRNLLKANPNALCVFRLNITKNTCGEGNGISPYIVRTLTSDSFDGFVGNLIRITPDKDDRHSLATELNRQDLVSEYRSGETNKHIDYRRKGEDGIPFWVRSYLNMLENPDTGDIEGVIYSVSIEDEMLESHAVDIITDQQFDFMAYIDISGGTMELRHVNSGLSKNYRKLAESLVSINSYGEIRSIMADRYVADAGRSLFLRETDIEAVTAAIAGTGHHEFIVEVHDDTGSIAYKRIQYYYMDDAGKDVLVLQGDITETYLLKQREIEEAEARTRKINDILDSISSGICVMRMTVTGELQLQYVNKRMFSMLGFDMADGSNGPHAPGVLDEYFRDSFSGVHPDDMERVIQTFIDNSESLHFTVEDYRLQCGDGSYTWVTDEVELREVTPEYRLYYGTFRDITEDRILHDRIRRQMLEEKELVRKAMTANEAKMSFLSRMSHDVRTPLNVITGMSYIARSYNCGSKVDRCLDKIDVASKFLLGMMNNILDMTKIEKDKIELRLEPYSFTEFTEYIESIIRPTYEKKHQVFNYDADIRTDDWALADKLRLNQIVFNLLSNASKYTPEYGSIALRLKVEDLSGRRMSVHIEVEDNGIGMSPEFQKVLFEPFAQEGRNDVSADRGSGLGLAIVKRMVELMHGTIRMHSEQGNGTFFAIDLEFDSVKMTGKDAAVTDKEKYMSSLEQNGSGATHLLLCEDHPLNQEVIRSILGIHGIDVDIAGNGRKGFDMFAESRPGYYKIILMDIHMPVMDGYEATRAIRGLPRKDAAAIPIIALTADAFAEDIKKCIATGMNTHIAKPIDPEELYITIMRLISGDL